MITNLGLMDYKMSIKHNLLNSHIENFPENLGVVSEEQDERFHQVLEELGRLISKTLKFWQDYDYCWLLKRDDPKRKFKRKSHN